MGKRVSISVFVAILLMSASTLAAVESKGMNSNEEMSQMTPLGSYPRGPLLSPIDKGLVPPPPQMPKEVPIVPESHGAFNPRTGEYYPPSGKGVLDSKTGEYYPPTDNGYFNPRTGEYYPQSDH